MTLAIKTLSEFVDQAVKLAEQPDHEFFWRGHSDASYKLVPGIYRKATKMISKEHLLIKEAILNHPAAFSSRHSFFEKLALLQHYEFPTRLLDLTGNPLVALYFACSGSLAKDGEVIFFSVKKDQVKYFDSDTVTVLSAISYIPPEKFTGFNEELKKHINADTTPELDTLRQRITTNAMQTAMTTLTKFLNSSACKDTALLKIRELFNQCALIENLHYEIRAEKPHFRPQIEPKHFNNAMVCVKSRYDNERIAAQQGAFLLYGVKDGEKAKPSDFEKGDIQVKRLTVDSHAKKDLLKSLARFGISDERMFPELMSSAKVIKDRYKI